eukprot:1365300-Amphidinium_carterae.1
MGPNWSISRATEIYAFERQPRTNLKLGRPHRGGAEQEAMRRATSLAKRRPRALQGSTEHHMASERPPVLDADLVHAVTNLLTLMRRYRVALTEDPISKPEQGIAVKGSGTLFVTGSGPLSDPSHDLALVASLRPNKTKPLLVTQRQGDDRPRPKPEPASRPQLLASVNTLTRPPFRKHCEMGQTLNEWSQS